MSLKPETINVVQQTVPVLREKGEAITTRMYEILFSKYPQTKPLFANASNQNVKLAQAILAYAQNINRLENMESAIERIAQRHVATGVKKEHYAMVADALISAMRDVLGAAMTAEVEEAWTQAYIFLADTLEGREQELYAQA